MERFAQRKSSAYHPVNTAILHVFAQQSDDQFHLDGEIVEMVGLVGLIETVNEMSMRVELVIRDEWGSADAVVYKKQGKAAQGLAGYNLERKGYALLLGTIRRFSTKLTLVIARLLPVEDYQAVINHRLSVLWTHYKRTKGGNLPLLEKKPENRLLSDLEPTESTILQELRDRKPPNRLLEGEKAGFAKEMGMRPEELERHLVKLTASGYLTKAHGGYVGRSN
jgi:uncharacterized protein YkvS